MAIMNRLRRNPFFLKILLNTYAPYVGAGVRITRLDLPNYAIDVEMPLTRLNKNYVGTQFGGSLYSMIDPFLMLIMMTHLGRDYIVWDKAANIDFRSAGRGTVHAQIRLNADDIEQVKQLAASGAPVLRTYPVDVLAEDGTVVAHIDKVLYIRKKKPVV